jgi:hypothetical protein
MENANLGLLTVTTEEIRFAFLKVSPGLVMQSVYRWMYLVTESAPKRKSLQLY